MKLIVKHPVLSLFLLAYAFTWWIFPLGSDSFPIFPYGPLVALLVLAGVRNGRQGVRLVFASLKTWRADPKWYAVALLVPLLIAAAAIVLARMLGAPESALPAPTSALEFVAILPVMIVIGGPLGEELAWRGFALPLLQRRFPRSLRCLSSEPGTGSGTYPCSSPTTPRRPAPSSSA